MTLIDWLGILIIAAGFLSTLLLIALVLYTIWEDRQGSKWTAPPDHEHRAVVYQLYPHGRRGVRAFPGDDAA